MLFKDIPGHNELKKKLIQTVKDNRISHAYLFAGPEGNGKLALALAYATYVSCKDKQEDDACGKCSSCIKFNKVIHPDLHFVFPVISTKNISKPVSDDFIKQWRDFVTSKPYHSFDKWLQYLGEENKQAGIFAHESNEIIKKLSYKTFEAEFKIMIVWMPEKMNIAAANKLLKMIEEPPAKTLFLLVTGNPNSIITTIRSRTQIINIPKIDNQSVFNYLKETYELADEKIKEIVRNAECSLLKAEEIIKFDDDSSESENYLFFTEFMRLSFSMKIDELNELIEQLSKQSRDKQKNFINYSTRLIRENFILNITGNSENNLVYLSGKEKNFSEKFRKFITKKNIEGLLNEFNLAHKHIERNGNDKLIFFDLALKSARLLKNYN